MSLPLKGMPFDRVTLDKATRRAFDAAKRRGKGVGWAEARRRGHLQLVLHHFPSFHRRDQGNLPSV